MIKVNDQQLEALGLPAMQGRVYLAALELGQATMQALSRKSGVNRSTIYTFMNELKARGYIFETQQGKRKIYSAANPDHLVAAERERMKNLEAFLPELQAINNESSTKPRVTYLEGMEGIREVYQDMARENKDIVSYEDLEHLKKGLSKSIYDWAPQERAKQGIHLSAISRDCPEARRFCENDKELLRTTKFIKDNDFKTEIKIYGSKIAMINLRGQTPFCVLIENKHLADTMRMIWQQLWQRL